MEYLLYNGTHFNEVSAVIIFSCVPVYSVSGLNQLHSVLDRPTLCGSVGFGERAWEIFLKF